MLMKPSKEVSTFTLKDFQAYDTKTKHSIDTDEVTGEILQALKYSGQYQQDVIKWMVEHNACVDTTTYHTAASREFINVAKLNASCRRNYKMREISVSEACRIYQNYSIRKTIATELENVDWNLNATIAEELMKNYQVNARLLQNIQRSRKLPSIPDVNSPVLALSAASDYLLRESFNGTTIYISDFCPLQTPFDLEFYVPKMFLKSHPNIYKIAKPNIRLSENELLFDFGACETCSYKPYSKIFCAVDLGVVNKALMMRYDAVSQTFSAPFGASSQTMFVVKSVNALETEKERLLKRRNNLVMSGQDISNIEIHIHNVCEKLIRLRKELSFAICCDLTALCFDGDVCVHEFLKWVMTSNRWTTTTCDDIDHVLHTNGIVTMAGRTAHSSDSCPVCGKIMVMDKRIAKCSCGFTCMRDTLSVLNQNIWAAQSINKVNYLTGNKQSKQNLSGLYYTLQDFSTNEIEPIVSWDRQHPFE